MPKLQDIIADKKRLFIGDDVPPQYLTDQYIQDVATVKPAHAVALPITQEEVQELVEYAIAEDLVIIARASNTGVAGGQTAITGNELIIDLQLMNRIVNLDEETFTLTVEPGALVGDIHEFVESKGYFYPPDPASKHSSIGGNVATNAGGLRAVKYGTTRNYIREMTIVLPTGEVLTVGDLNVKSSSGYDMKNLFIGSEGTLGIITEIKLRIIPLPQVQQSILISFADVFEATDGNLSILESGAEPAEVELFERRAAEYAEKFLGYPLPAKQGNALLLVQVDGNDAKAVQARMDLLIEAVTEKALEVIPLLDPEEAQKTRSIRDKILTGLSKFTRFEMLDEVVPINKFAELIQYTKELEEKHQLNVINFGHAGDGNIHTVLMREDLSDEEWKTRHDNYLDDLYQKVDDLGGLPSAEHGIGIVKKAYFEKMTADVNLHYMRQIKKVFDPDNRLNPGKLI